MVTILPPASLSVHSVPVSNYSLHSRVPVPAYDDSVYAEHTQNVAYAGSRITRLVSSASTAVRIVPMHPPYPFIKYDVDFHGPSLSCTLEKFDRPADIPNIVEIYNFSNQTTNVLSFYTLRNDKYVQCTLYNTSFRTTFSFENSVQSVDISTRELLNPVKYPRSPNDNRDVPYSFSYQAWMDPISDQLIGHIGYDPITKGVQFASGIALTSLIYSSDLKPLLADLLPDDAEIDAEQLFRPLEDLLEE